MFQIAFAKALSLKYNQEIYVDLSVYKKYKIREFSLNNLYINKSLKNYDEAPVTLKEKIHLKTSQVIYHIYQKVYKDLTRKDNFGRFAYSLLVPRGLYFNFDRYYYEEPMNKSETKCVYGYFQSEQYFKEYKSQIVNELKVSTPLTFKEKVQLDEILNCESVCVSMRLGDDYERSSSLNLCKEDYYYKAMEYMYKKNNNIVFFIFSDCIEKVKQRFNFNYPVRYIEGYKDYESLRLMYNCKHFIISNSSFSWWGAYLGMNTDKIILSPEKWYNDCKIRPDIFFDGMTSIEI